MDLMVLHKSSFILKALYGKKDSHLQGTHRRRNPYESSLLQQITEKVCVGLFS
ncbi:hypothetical protein SAMN05444162_4612 [Paenibacillaceae bacterium GAS479]|nr:hypothetical protein SAMN05444162_4612 [Paenibacillaceae bacterium GAS479]